MAEYSRTGYWLVDLDAEEGKEPLKIEDERPEHNSGCTDLKFIPMYDDSTFPYVISRNKFKIDLIDHARRTSKSTVPHKVEGALVNAIVILGFAHC